jgi:hypothetical protein
LLNNNIVLPLRANKVWDVNPLMDGLHAGSSIAGDILRNHWRDLIMAARRVIL